MSDKPNTHKAVHVERIDGVLQLTINAPANRNALSSPGVLAGLDEHECESCATIGPA
ncbi:hypothetical protein [Paraburkholderia sediminicola]|uniref:hypothetical protein n=1 Tax=Paraburkholderia sediminicola TaxID=458836 RepID=UPI0038B8AE1A